MRVVLVIVGSLTTGALGIGANHGVFPGPDQMFQAVTALGGDPAKAVPAKVGITDGGLVQTYNNVTRQVTSGNNAVDFHGTAVTLPPGSFRGMNGPNVIEGGRSGFTSGIMPEARQNNRRMEDMATYARNPAAWHGMPPH